MFKKITQGLSISLLIMYASAAEAKRVALIVGNAAYKNENVLSNPINDARLIAKTLQNDLSFDDVKIIENADMRSLNRAVDEFGHKANGADAAFVYFSGHGLQTTDKQNYLLAVDAQIEQESDLKVSAITSEALVAATEGAKIRLVVLDACRDRPNSVYKTKSATKGLTRAKDPSINGLLIAYATEDGQVAQDGRSGGNSPYATALVAELKKRDKPIMAMFDEVMESVVKQTNGAQNPTRSGNLTVKVYLVDPIIMPVIAPAAMDDEKEFWNEIKNSRNVKDFKAYKQQFPKGRFVPLADNRIEELQAANTSNGVVVQNKPHEDLPLTNPEFKKWYDLAIKGDAAAQANLGFMYDNGKGVTKDYAKALEWYGKAAEQGFANGQHNLGLMYYNGTGVTKDYAKALEWHGKAAEQGDVNAQFRLGYMYQTGLGIGQDDAKALEWYGKALEWTGKAAEQGDATAQGNLGFMYKNGLGTSRDKNKAIEWLCKAAVQDNDYAKSELTNLNATCPSTAK